MNIKKGILAVFLIFTTVVVLGAISIVLFWPAFQGQIALILGNERNQTPVPTPTVTVPPTPTPNPNNFSETGNIVYDPGFPIPDDDEYSGWAFLYEKPGAPALKVRIIFVPESTCYFGQIENSCTSTTFASGDRMKIEGKLVGQAVIVSTMTRITGSSMIANPASVYCIEQGGRSEIVTASDGSQSGNCVFPDGRKCDEWDFFRTNVCGK